MADVGCTGIVVEDIFCGPMSRLPAEGQLLAIGRMSSHVGGCAANVAIDLKKQGRSVDLVGCTGDDASAKFITHTLENHGINCKGLVSVRDHLTSKTVILLVEGQDRRYIHVFGANAAFNISHIDKNWVSGLNVFYLGGLCAMPGIDFDELLDLMCFCRQKGIVTVLDVVVPQNFSEVHRLQKLLPFVDYFLPNDDEAKLLTGVDNVLDQLRMFQSWGAAKVIVTQGKAGAIAASGGQFWRSGIFSINVVDPSGSGDAFTAGVIAGILDGADMPSILRYGSALGASATLAIGTTDGVFLREQAKKFMAANDLQITSGTL